MNGPDHITRVTHPQLAETLGVVPVAAVLVDAGGAIIYANSVLLSMFGYLADELLYRPVEVLLPASQRVTHANKRKAQSRHFRTKATGRDLNVIGQHRGGQALQLEVRLQSVECELGMVTLAFVSHQQHEPNSLVELQERNRALRLLHDCNDILVRARSEHDLLSGIAQAISSTGRFPQVWIGCSVEGSSSFKNSVCAGNQCEFVACAGVSGVEPLARNALDQGVMIEVAPERLLELAPQYCAMQPDRVLSFMLALPLLTADAVYGCLCVASVAGRRFAAHEIELLQELADDLAFGLDALHGRRLRRDAEARLRLLERAVEASGNAIIITDALDEKHPILYVNPAFERITGYHAADALGRNGRFLLGEDRDQPALEDIRAALRGRHEANALLRNYRKDGSLFWNELTVSPVPDGAGLVTHFVSVMNDFTARKEQEEQIERHALYDFLTGLPNRAALFSRIKHAIGSAQRDGYGIGVLLIALDRFSLVNDAYGHDTGDELLRAVATRLLDTSRSRDTVARLGGDEFVVLLSTPGVDDTVAVVDKIYAALAEPFRLTCCEIIVSASIGVSLAPRDGGDAQALIRNAEVAMKGAKTGGWNTMRFYAEEMNQRTGERLAMEFDLRRALENNEFEIHYQPIIDIESGQIVEAEALLRWNRPRFGLVAPDHFIPLAEASGLILPIGNWVLHEACRQNAAWRGAGLASIRIAVNLSARQFREPGLDLLVGDALEEHGLAGSDLVLEVTESLLMTHIDSARETLLRLKNLGVHISLDDFGTGYSSLSYLNRLPPDTLKIDRSFVSKITTDANDAAIVSTIISMARTLRLGVVAEGVETMEQLAFLRENGCQRAQGYAIGRPVSATVFEALLLG